MIKRINNDKDDNVCDMLLTKLIQDERQYNDSIDENMIVSDYFNKVIKNKGNVLLGYYDNDNVIGYIFIKYIDDNNCLIDGLFVLEEHRNKGIAKQLITEALKVCKELNYKYVDINVMDKNIIAKKLYQDCGFNSYKINMRKEI